MFGNKKIEKIALLVTKKCNLKCEYCYILQNDKTFPENKIASLIKFIETTAGETKKIIFVGGEPFLELPLIKKICSRLDKIKNKKITKIINTNCTILGNEQIKSLNLFDIISISVDGCKRDNDLNRQTANGQGTFEAIKTNFAKIKKNFSGKIALSLVVSPETAKNLFENVRLIYSYFKPDNFKISVPLGYFGWSKQSLNELHENCVRLSDFIEKNKLKEIFPDLYSKTKNCLLNSISVDVNGDIYACEYVIDRNIKPMANINGETYFEFLHKCSFDPNSSMCSDERCLKCNSICRKKDGSLDTNLVAALQFRNFF